MRSIGSANAERSRTATIPEPSPLFWDHFSRASERRLPRGPSAVAALASLAGARAATAGCCHRADRRSPPPPPRRADCGAIHQLNVAAAKRVEVDPGRSSRNPSTADVERRTLAIARRWTRPERAALHLTTPSSHAGISCSHLCVPQAVRLVYAVAPAELVGPLSTPRCESCRPVEAVHRRSREGGLPIPLSRFVPGRCSNSSTRCSSQAQEALSLSESQYPVS